jgi:hypothetical protein
MADEALSVQPFCAHSSTCGAFVFLPIDNILANREK